MKNFEILVIDDEVTMRKLLEITLHANGYKYLGASTAKEGLQMAKQLNPDLILLDLGLPDESGHEVLKKLRDWYNKPVLILSVQSSEEEIVMALDNGANDYLIKPFRTGELLARIRSCLRGSSQLNSSAINKGDLQIDHLKRVIKKKEEVLKLSATEYDLLALFLKNEGKVLTHQYLLREVWGPAYVDQTQYLRVFIAQLRKKIEEDATNPLYIVTESGVGYRFTEQEENY